MAKRRTEVGREQDLSGFTRILQNFLDATPGALGAVLVDDYGLAVDYAGGLEAFDVKVAGAHMQLELRKAGSELPEGWGPVQQVIVRAARRSYVARTLQEGYVLVVVMCRGAGYGISERAVAQVEFDLRAEGGWTPPKGVERWVHARVEPLSDDRRRPRRVLLDGKWHDLQVIGSVVGLARGERGYRVRLDTGAEFTLVRERLGRWYTDTQLQ